jgi:hypothetical protein
MPPLSQLRNIAVSLGVATLASLRLDAVEAASSINDARFYARWNVNVIVGYPMLTVGDSDALLNSVTYKLYPEVTGSTVTAYLFAPLPDGKPGTLLAQTVVTPVNWATDVRLLTLAMATPFRLTAHTSYLVQISSTASPSQPVTVAINETGERTALLGWSIGATAMTYFDFGDPWKEESVIPQFSIDVTFLTAPRNYAEWAARNFPASDLALPAISGATADPDGSGLANLQRYAFGLPARGPVGPTVAQTTTVEGGATYSAVRFNTVAAGDDITYTVEASGDLATWTPVKTFAATTAGTQTVRDTVPVTGATRRFVRVKVTLTP